jgi:hypothetical protein
MPQSVYPCIGMVISGGHTSLYHCTGPLDMTYLGGTIDDAAGEAFDKVAAMLRLGFPGGPAVSQLAQSGDAKAYQFPRAMIHDANYAFSFSGLKTAVRYAIAGPGKVDFDSLQIDPQTKANICASFEAAVVQCLVVKATRAVKQHRVGQLCVGGGGGWALGPRPGGLPLPRLVDSTLAAGRPGPLPPRPFEATILPALLAMPLAAVEADLLMTIGGEERVLDEFLGACCAFDDDG